MVKENKIILPKVTYSRQQLRQEMKMMNDWLAGRRKRIPLGWSRRNSVSLPTARWIRAFRRSLKLDFHEFGGLAGVQDADVREWENGKSSPSTSASRLLGLLALKPHLVKFMQAPWPDDQITKGLRGLDRK